MSREKGLLLTTKKKRMNTENISPLQKQEKNVNLTKELQIIKKFLHREFGEHFIQFREKELRNKDVEQDEEPEIAKDNIESKGTQKVGTKSENKTPKDKSSILVLDPEAERLKQHRALLCPEIDGEEMPYTFLRYFDNWELAKLHLRRQGWILSWPWPFKKFGEYTLCNLKCNKVTRNGSCLKKLVAIRQSFINNLEKGASKERISIYQEKIEHTNHPSEEEEAEQEISSDVQVRSKSSLTKTNTRNQYEDIIGAWKNNKAKEEKEISRKKNKKRKLSSSHTNTLYPKKVKTMTEEQNPPNILVQEWNPQFYSVPPIYEEPMMEDEEIKVEILYPIFNFEEEEEVTTQNVKFEEVEEVDPISEINVPIVEVPSPPNLVGLQALNKKSRAACQVCVEWFYTFELEEHISSTHCTSFVRGNEKVFQCLECQWSHATTELNSDKLDMNVVRHCAMHSKKRRLGET